MRVDPFQLACAGGCDGTARGKIITKTDRGGSKNSSEGDLGDGHDRHEASEDALGQAALWLGYLLRIGPEHSSNTPTLAFSVDLKS